LKRTVEVGKTLLVDGPASVTLLTGVADILGAPIQTATKIVIREGKRFPFEIKENAEFDLLLGEKAGANEAPASTIPKSWEDAANTILDLKSLPVIVMIVGGIDSGKTSFSAYLANKALKMKRTVAMIDADLGQSDVGPPSTIGSCRITKPIRDPFEISAENVCFIGVTSPGGAVPKVIDGIAKVKEKVMKRGASLLIVNTDGWIDGEDAIRYKVALAKQVKPDIVVAIQEKNELTFLLGALIETQNLAIESSPAVRKRDREERRLLRELSYKKYLKGATVESFPLSWIRISGVTFGTGAKPSRERMNKIAEHLGTTPIYCEETPSSIFMVLSKEQWADEEIAASLEGIMKKKIKIVWQGDEEGLLVALHNKDENFLGIGILQETDYERRVLKIFTRVKSGVASIHVGQMKLDRTGKELGQTDVFADYT
jgi:polynucleotide 5'-hydroxyl-kinase GRC3/NOL9